MDDRSVRTSPFHPGLDGDTSEHHGRAAPLPEGQRMVVDNDG